MAGSFRRFLSTIFGTAPSPVEPPRPIDPVRPADPVYPAEQEPLADAAVPYHPAEMAPPVATDHPAALDLTPDPEYAPDEPALAEDVPPEPILEMPPEPVPEAPAAEPRPEVIGLVGGFEAEHRFWGWVLDKTTPAAATIEVFATRDRTEIGRVIANVRRGDGTLGFTLETTTPVTKEEVLGETVTLWASAGDEPPVHLRVFPRLRDDILRELNAAKAAEPDQPTE